MLGNPRIRSVKLYSFFTSLPDRPPSPKGGRREGEGGGGGGRGVSVHELILYVCRRARSLRNSFTSGKTSGNSMVASGNNPRVCIYSLCLLGRYP